MWREFFPATAISVRGEVLQPIVVRCKENPVVTRMLVLLEDHTCDQAYTRAQNTYQGEGAGYGSVGAADEDGMDGVEVEEGRGEFGSSV